MRDNFSWTRKLRQMDDEEIRARKGREDKWMACGDSTEKARVRVNPDGMVTVSFECLGIWCDTGATRRTVEDVTEELIWRGFDVVS